MTLLLAALSAGLSGIAIFASMGLGGAVTTSPGFSWVLALLAPVPVLWFAFRGESRGWLAALAAFIASAIGTANILSAYAGTLPAIVLVMAILTPALGFTAAVAGARYVARRVAPISGIIAFAAIWTAADYLLSQGPNGAASSPAYSQIEMPWMIQGASVFGLWAITAVMGLFSAALAMGIARRAQSFALLALAVLALNLGYGHIRMANAPKTESVRVGLAADDSLVRTGLKDDEKSALTVVKAYAQAGKALASQNANLIIFPEKIFVLRPAWKGAVNAEFETLAHMSHAMVVAGADERGEARKNSALVYFSNGMAPESYVKRHLVPGLESTFVPGAQSYMTGERTGIAICKDMDFPEMLRGDALLGPNLYAVPAWDFDRDAIWHARLAILRGVENGFAVARSANDGLLTLSDAYGRVLAVDSTAKGGMVLLRGDLPRGPGKTLYGQIGDSLAYLALALSLLLLAVAVFAKPRPEKI
ncbi:apolipoprotein N-acyltransferase [Rhizomicrobium palustre]|uniref:Apolipoprotein N-acyltransferase n=1 Tax=Rhizomicrobium palustre TaxID=189966 RepID=A0A846MY62_9PROT|nr:nitrilase-related carbon-nitrogen hydrolase [Rhizomicrobium palustre]NIK88223.1 apolipoprotein N-acyltransferase [Rhizomicrobium palustre]